LFLALKNEWMLGMVTEEIGENLYSSIPNGTPTVKILWGKNGGQI
jgi:hypothetical protein